jgi:hypothetical protein
MENIQSDFVANAEKFLLQEVNSIAQKRGYISKNASVPFSAYNGLYITGSRIIAFKRNGLEVFNVVISREPSLLFQNVLSPCGMQYKKLVKTLAENAISAIYES